MITTEDDVVRVLEALEPGDKEANHADADAALLAFLDNAHPRVSAAWRSAEERDGGWWYA